MIRLSVLLAVLGAPAAALCPDPSQEGPRYVATGAELLAPHSFDIVAGGTERAPCAQWVISGVETGDLAGVLPLAPTAVFDLEAMAPHILTVTARAACRPVLVVRSGDGQWFFGRTGQDQQDITLWAVPDGPLQIWVGAAQAGGCDGTIALETFDR